MCVMVNMFAFVHIYKCMYAYLWIIYSSGMHYFIKLVIMSMFNPYNVSKTIFKF